MAAGGDVPAGTADETFPPTPPPVATPAPESFDNAEPVGPTETSTPVPPATPDTDDPSTGTAGNPAG
jgi:hypothetical protein